MCEQVTPAWSTSRHRHRREEIRMLPTHRGRRGAVAAGLVTCAVLLGSLSSPAIAEPPGADGKDKLTGTASGIAVHPVFGFLPFTDTTDGQSDGVAPKGGGTIQFDFSQLGLGVVELTYRYTCLTAIGGVSIHRFVVIASSNEVIAPPGTLGFSSVVDGKGTGGPDTDRALFPAPDPAPGTVPCSLDDRRVLLEDPSAITFTVTSGNWTVHDGLPTSP
ncbi:hypothetical protein ACI797_22810 [Geodermatophilus sp. SYSU D00691]